MDEQTLATRILTDAERHAEERGMRLGDGAHGFFEQHARNAARELVSDPQLSEGKVRAMVAVFERLIDEMIGSSQTIKGYAAGHPGVIGEDTLADALRKLCPIFPFC